MSENNWNKIILFGDSLVQKSFEPDDGRWGSLIADRLQRICDVLARGFSGYNSRWCKLILPKIFPKTCDTKDIICFVILLGANDSNEPESPKGQYVPIEEYKQNLIDMVSYLEQIGIAKNKIILMTPGVYHHDEYVKSCKLLNKDEPIKNNLTVCKYAQACVDAAKTCEVDVLNLFELFSKQKDSKQLLCDGLHFSKLGSELVFENLWPFIEQKVKDSGNTELGMNFPIYSDIDIANPEKSLLN